MNNFTTLDIFIGLFILVFLILGFIKGAIRQFFGILAIIMSSTASVLIPYFVKLPDIEGISIIWKDIIFSILIWIPAFLILNGIGKFIARKMTKKGITIGDRIWGAVFGTAKGIMIIIILVFFIDILPLNITASIPDSRIADVIKPYNPILKIDIVKNLAGMMLAADDPDYMELLNKDSDFRELCQMESVKSILDDKEMKETLNKQQYLKFIANPKVQALVRDKEALKLLLGMDVENVAIKNI